jgi:hypothetical protein
MTLFTLIIGTLAFAAFIIWKATAIKKPEQVD